MSTETADIADLVRGVAAKLGVTVERQDGLPRRPEAPPEEKREQRRIEARLAAMATIPSEFQWATSLDAHELAKRSDPAATKRVRESEHRVVTTFVGPSRAGKSSLATALFSSRLNLEQWPTGLWAPATRFMVEALREVGLGDEPPMLAKARRVSVLLIDDLGQEPERDESRALIEDLIAERHREHRTTIVTTGLRAEDLSRRYGDGVKERLTEEGRALVVVCKRRNSSTGRAGQ